MGRRNAGPRHHLEHHGDVRHLVGRPSAWLDPPATAAEDGPAGGAAARAEAAEEEEEPSRYALALRDIPYLKPLERRELLVQLVTPLGAALHSSDDGAAERAPAMDDLPSSAFGFFRARRRPAAASGSPAMGT